MKKLFLTFLLLSGLSRAVAQVFPVQATPQLVPPYSVYLADYAQPDVEKLRVVLLLKDLSQPSYQVRLSLSLELNGRVILRTSAAFNPPPVEVEAGVPTVFSGADLAPYLESRNLDFVGLSREQYERTRALPEGAYRLCVTAFDYRIRTRPVQVSNEGCAFFYLAKAEPPLVNTPACGTRIPVREVVQIVFSWLPRNTASPNSAQETEYELSLYETRPAGRNPNDVVLTTKPVFETRTELTQFVYGMAEPMLLEGMQYVWRVRAIDKSGKDAFRNQGYSEVCTFSYEKDVPEITVGKVAGFSAKSEGERRAGMQWSADPVGFDTYAIQYRKVQPKPDGKKWDWFSLEKKGSENEAKVMDLEPDTEYETRLEGKKQGVSGGYSELVTFRTNKPKPAVCGESAQAFPAADATKPLDLLLPGMILQARGLEVTVTQVSASQGGGYFGGQGRVSLPYLGGAAFAVQFRRIYVDAERNVGTGRIDFVSTTIEDAMARGMIVNLDSLFGRATQVLDKIKGWLSKPKENADSLQNYTQTYTEEVNVFIDKNPQLPDSVKEQLREDALLVETGAATASSNPSAENIVVAQQAVEQAKQRVEQVKTGLQNGTLPAGSVQLPPNPTGITLAENSVFFTLSGKSIVLPKGAVLLFYCIGDRLDDKPYLKRFKINGRTYALKANFNTSGTPFDFKGYADEANPGSFYTSLPLPAGKDIYLTGQNTLPGSSGQVHLSLSRITLATLPPPWQAGKAEDEASIFLDKSSDGKAAVSVAEKTFVFDCSGSEAYMNKLATLIRQSLSQHRGIAYEITDCITGKKQTIAADNQTGKNIISLSICNGAIQVEGVKYNQLQKNAKLGNVSQTQLENAVADKLKEELQAAQANSGGKAPADGKLRGESVNKTVTNAEGKPEQIKIDKSDMWAFLPEVVELGENIYENAALPEKYWNDKDGKYTNSPVQMPGMVAGVSDGVLNEATESLQMIKFGLEVATKPEIITQTWEKVKTLKAEDVRKLVVGTVAGKADKYGQGGAVMYHEAGVDGVMVATMVIAGVKNLKKAKDIIDKVEDGVEKKADELAQVLDENVWRKLVDDLGFTQEHLERVREAVGEQSNDFLKELSENNTQAAKKLRTGINSAEDAEKAARVWKIGNKRGEILWIRSTPESKLIAEDYWNNPLTKREGYTDFNAWYRDKFLNKLSDAAPFQAHHLLPIDVLYTNKKLQDIIQWAEKNGRLNELNLNGLDNGIMLSIADHSAPHPNFSTQMFNKVVAIGEEAVDSSKKFDNLKNLLNDVKQQIKTEVVQGSKKLNEITLN
jgi:hypothetical protein